MTFTLMFTASGSVAFIKQPCPTIGVFGVGALLSGIRLFSRGASGFELDKQAAADRIKEKYRQYIATPTERGGGLGLEPEEYPPGESSDRLSWFKANRPEEFWKRIEDIRAGRVDRNYNRWIDDKSPLHALTEEDYV